MAIADLYKEAKILGDLFKSGRGAGTMFELMEKESHTHTIDANGLTEELLQHQEKTFTGVEKYRKRDTDQASDGMKLSSIDKGTATIGGQKGLVGKNTPQYEEWNRRREQARTASPGADDVQLGFAIRPFSEKKQELLRFCKAYVKGVTTNLRGKWREGFIINSSSPNSIEFVLLANKLGGNYKTLSKFLTETATDIVDNDEGFKELFSRSKQEIGSLIALGHDTAYATEKLTQAASLLERAKTIDPDAFKNSTDMVQGRLKEFGEAGFDLEIDLEHARTLNLNTGQFDDKRTVKTNAESGWLNTIKGNRPELTGHGFSELNIGHLAKKAVQEFRKDLEKKYGKDAANMPGSQTMLEAAQAMILYGSIKGVNKKNYKLNSKLTPPEQGRKTRTAEAPRIHSKNKAKKAKPNMLGLGGSIDVDHKPLIKKQGRGKTESGTSLAPLLALLNAKLPETVARNMGPPGLENQTGRFASSVRVTDVSRTAQGFPSVGYDYQRNPYQVFEMGRGQPPWATSERDPRNLIDKSIREIAAQLAIGRFYTRRI